MKLKTYGGVALAATVALASFASHADDDDEHERGEHGHGGREGKPRGLASSTAAARAAPEWKTYEAECGSCHLAYPPSLLPAASWQALLSNLDDHFGQNAELDAPTARELSTFLSAWAATPRRTEAPPPLRITELTWWRHKHDEVNPRVWKREAVGSKANCTACHLNANQGDFNEDRVQIPRDATPAR
ncbi:diheme cytochrome c [Myxococcus sp. RHSTA-1-4]|uniref:diheme cytochrome c n=1 Tax=Myxococcus sp. RHSTA-1-4 TaxID=2874601 RepID=UPI001CBC740C|nr:diheme cytochrome c [Myxococcus sp. RHSTA-1-4]MBZ4421275.1 diheme cytochrome c [Myxococcus sp. RHSTA-1-4]